MINIIMVFTISVFIVFGLAFYFYKTERKRVVKRYFKSRIIYENNRQNLYTILNLYFKKNNINYIHINIYEIYLQGRNNNEINVTYTCIENSKKIDKSINILIKDL